MRYHDTVPNIVFERQRRRQQKTVSGCMLFLFILTGNLVADIYAFNAKLSRPWEPMNDHHGRLGGGGPPTATTTTRKSRRFYRIRELLASRAGIRIGGRDNYPRSSSTATASSTAISGTVQPNDNGGGDSSEAGEKRSGKNDNNPSDSSSSSLSSSELFLASMAEGTTYGRSIHDDDDDDNNNNNNNNNNKNRVNGAPYVPAPTVWTSKGSLFQLTRPANFPGVVFLHLLGGYLSLTYTGQGSLFNKILFRTPSMWVVLAALLLTSSTSMVVNDYYDSKLGRDTEKPNNPLVSGTLTLALVRQFLNYLYAVALLAVAVTPGVPSRISVVLGLMLTFWYTKHLKPLTWVKNVMCASLIALSPFTSGMAALKLASEIGSGPWGNLQVLIVPNLWRLVAFLFFGVCGREIMMDVTDLKDDKLNRVLTIPVKHGRSYASGVAMACYLLSALWVVTGPVTQVFSALGETATFTALKAALLANKGLCRRLLFGGIGGFMLVRRGIQLFVTKGEDQKIVDSAVAEAQLAMIVCLVSFI